MQCYDNQSFDSLLVVLTTNDKVHPSLKRAANLANKTQAKITALLVGYDRTIELISSLSPQHGNQLKDDFIRKQQTWLKQQIDRPELKHLKIKTTVCWHKYPHVAIASQINQFHYDLVIKSSGTHNEFESLFITPTDWHLLRECHGPILLVKSTHSASKPRILLAIDLDNNNAFHHAFNVKMLQQANHLSGTLHTEVHMINCFLEHDISMAMSAPNESGEMVKNIELVKQQHLAKLYQLANQYHINQQNVHLVNGLADFAIPRVAKNINAELVIMGSCGRSGLSERILGHTAEHVFDQINCDMLTVKPDENRQPPDNFH